MSPKLNRRKFIRQSILTSTSGALAMHTGETAARGQSAGENVIAANVRPEFADSLPKGKIGDMLVSRILLGGNLLTHFTHSRDLKYVYSLAEHYNTDEKILETLRDAESHGVDTLVIHTVPRAMNVLRKHRYELGGKIQWIICPTAVVDDSMEAYRKQVREIVDMGVEAVYLWGVRADQLVSMKRVDLITNAVNVAKEFGVLSGVGAHDLRVVVACEEKNVDADFYIKTLHHHSYPTAPKPGEATKVTSEVPGYWCSNPQEVVDFMKKVEKPWIAFKVMAAGAIPPENAFQFAFENGVDHIIAGMFDFEIAEDVQIAKAVLSRVKRERDWRS